MNPTFSPLQEKILLRLTHQEFLAEVHIEEERIVPHLFADNFVEQVRKIEGREDLLSTDVLTLCADMMDAFSPEPERGWLHYTAQFWTNPFQRQPPSA